jgi:hypothetical protein
VSTCRTLSSCRSLSNSLSKRGTSFPVQSGGHCLGSSLGILSCLVPVVVPCSSDGVASLTVGLQFAALLPFSTAMTACGAPCFWLHLKTDAVAIYPFYTRNGLASCDTPACYSPGDGWPCLVLVSAHPHVRCVTSITTNR